MGCLWTRPSQSQPSSRAEPKIEPPKQYSWDTRGRVDTSQWTVDSLLGDTHVRQSGSVDGEQFIIQHCKDSNIYILDHSVSVTIDDCSGCKIFLGPTHTSVFVRTCTDCVITAACQQFRTRDCHHLTVFLCVATQPIIEVSTGIRLACLQCSYVGVEAHFRKSSLSVFNNNWSRVHDFTPVLDEHNFTLLSEDVLLADVMPVPTAELSASALEFSTDSSVIPLTLGTRCKPSNESCLIVFFNDGLSTERALSFISDMKKLHGGCTLVQSREMSMQLADCQRVFNTDSYASAAKQGPVIALEYNGDECCTHCQEQVIAVSKGSTGLVFVSNSPVAATRHIDAFFSFANKEMLP